MKIEWIHKFPDEPVVIFHEYDEEGNEKRRVEKYGDSTYAYVSAEVSYNAFLSEKKLPSLKEISENKEFRAHAISEKDFENVWSTALKSNKEGLQP